jgi:gamma-glutamyltranspeptidase / glutathione hydrolase
MNRVYILLLAVSIVACNPSEKKLKQVNGLIADSAMVVSAHPLASQIGTDILKKGGNAIDASIAVQFALAVVFPEAGNVGGGGFMLYRSAKGKYEALDYREKAPAAATTNMFLDSTGTVKAGLSTDGHLASGVPGSVDGMVEAHRRFGSMPWKDLVQPAIDLALKGVPLTRREASNMNSIQDDLVKYNATPPAFLVNNWSEGDTIKWTALAHTLELIRDNGRAGFYEGKVAHDIIEEMKAGKGLITEADLANYHSRWLDPLVSTYKEYSIASMPPPSSGGVALIQLFKCVEPYPISEWGHNSAQTVHLMTEAERRVFADRATYLGDPAFVNVPVAQLTNTLYIKERMSTFNPEKATPSKDIREGTLHGEPTETTHISIIDKFGNAVAVTTTLNDWFGSMVFINSAGFFLNNEMDDFSIKPGVANYYGVTGGEANKIMPAKTMLSSMTPTIIEKDGRLLMVIGSPGGSRIITAVFQVALNVLEHSMGMQQAVDAPRQHSQWLPDAIYIEDRALASNDSLRLTALGHTVRSIRDFHATFVGRVDAILVLPNGKLEAGADHTRGDDNAQGY